MKFRSDREIDNRKSEIRERFTRRFAPHEFCLLWQALEPSIESLCFQLSNINDQIKNRPPG